MSVTVKVSVTSSSNSDIMKVTPVVKVGLKRCGNSTSLSRPLLDLPLLLFPFLPPIPFNSPPLCHSLISTPLYMESVVGLSFPSRV